MSIQNIGTNKWRVNVKLGIDPKTGKAKYANRVVNGPKKDAITLEARLSNRGISSPKSSMPLGSFMDDLWVPSLTVSANTAAKYRSYSKNYIVPQLGSIPLKDLSPYAIEMFLKELPEGSVRESARSTLSVALNKAVAWGILDDSPLRKVKIKIGKGNKRGFDSYSREEAERIIELVKDTPIEPGVLVMLFCARRREEACGLDWDDIDLNTGVVNVWRAFIVESDSGKASLVGTKTEKSASPSYLDGYALSRLREIGEGATGPIMVTRGARMRPDYFYRQFKRIVEKSGMRYLPVNHLRHTFATLALDAGISVADVSELLNHTKISTTVNRYVRPREEAKRSASAKFASLLSEHSNS